MHDLHTLDNQFKVLSHTGYPGIPIGGYTGVAIRVNVCGVADGEVATDRVDTPTSCWKYLWIRGIADTNAWVYIIIQKYSIPHPGDLRWWDTSG